MGANTHPAREGKCKEDYLLISGRFLYCDREEDHPGQHCDHAEGLWWYPTAPQLEVVTIGCNLCGEKLLDGEPHLCRSAS